MKNQLCNGCLIAIKQGFTDGKLLFCTQSCEEDFHENGNRPVQRRRSPRSSA